MYDHDIQEPIEYSDSCDIRCSLVLRMVPTYSSPRLFLLADCFPRFQQWLHRTGVQKQLLITIMIFVGLGQFFVFLFRKHKCLTYLHVHTCRMCLCERCVPCSPREWKRLCLSLASAVVPMPSFQISGRIPQSRWCPKPQILSSLLVFHNPDYFGTSSSYFTFYLIFYLLMLLYGQLCLGKS